MASRLLLHTATPKPTFCFHFSYSLPSSLPSTGIIPRRISNDRSLSLGLHPPWKVKSSSRRTEYDAVTSGSVSEKDVIDDEKSALHGQVSETNEIKKRINEVKTMLRSMEDGEISISPYDTAWVALVRDIGSDDDSPQFPSSIEWIATNQLPDGSWGDPLLFSAHDRIINTLASVIALTSWNLHPQKCRKGMEFLKENLRKLEDENEEHMPIGFEVAFPSLLDIARSMNIEVPHDSPFLRHIFAVRDLKLKKIPREVMYKVPTTLLHSLEGMPNLEWKELLKLQSQDGSFLFSPSSTAFALMQTKDEASLKYLDKVVNRFNGGVPNVYPVDLFEHLWAVDRLERLGISRYFQQEINDCVTYVSRYWSEKGIAWARNSEVQDIDDTAMGFRILRLHRHPVSPSVFKNFEKEGEFLCFAGQSTQAVTGMFNLYRASQVLFPGEKILEDANQFSAKYLTHKRAANQLLDKWIMTKDLPGEVGYALDVPWYASLPRLETRFYIEHYGGQNDVWIGKTLYRMPYVNNDVYLELAKLDYNNCQAMHLTEWAEIQGWYSESALEEFGLSRQSLLFAYFVASASIFEPERSQERLAWAKTAALIETISSFISDEETMTTFVERFNHCINGRGYSIDSGLNKKTTEDRLIEVLLATLDFLASQASMSHGHEIVHHLRQAWQSWMSSWETEGNRAKNEGKLVVQMINSSGGYGLKELELNPHYQRLLEVTNTVCNRLRNYRSNKAHDCGNCYLSTNYKTTPEIESEMQEIVQLVLQNPPNGIDSIIINTFLTVAKGFYYAAYFDPDTINSHIAEVLFHKVM